MGRYYKLNTKVLANCGSKKEPDWIPGTIIELTNSEYFPYFIRLEKESDGELEWYFPTSFIKADTPRNRNKSGL